MVLGFYGYTVKKYTIPGFGTKSRIVKVSRENTHGHLTIPDKGSAFYKLLMKMYDEADKLDLNEFMYKTRPFYWIYH